MMIDCTRQQNGSLCKLQAREKRKKYGVIYRVELLLSTELSFQPTLLIFYDVFAQLVLIKQSLFNLTYFGKLDCVTRSNAKEQLPKGKSRPKFGP
jgi:hypothetical protein